MNFFKKIVDFFFLRNKIVSIETSIIKKEEITTNPKSEFIESGYIEVNETPKEKKKNPRKRKPKAAKSVETPPTPVETPKKKPYKRRPKRKKKLEE